MKTLYQLSEYSCLNCNSKGPLLLDPSDPFTVQADGTVTFPEGEWGLDIECKCPACGFGGRLGDFCEWVDVTHGSLTQTGKE